MLWQKKTVISKVLDAEVVDGIIEFPQNKTLYVEQFTDMAPVKPGEVFQPAAEIHDGGLQEHRTTID